LSHPHREWPCGRWSVHSTVAVSGTPSEENPSDWRRLPLTRRAEAAPTPREGRGEGLWRIAKLLPRDARIRRVHFNQKGDSRDRAIEIDTHRADARIALVLG